MVKSVDVMNGWLDGNRIRLRPFENPLTPDEIARVYRWSSDDQVLRWSGGAPTDLTQAEFSERLLSDHAQPVDHRRIFFIATRQSEIIGRIGIFAIDWQKKEGELGIAIGEHQLWGQGYGRDAITTLLHHMFQTTSLERVNLYTFPDNLRAQRCFAACGFRTLGTTRHFSPDIGEYAGIEMAITRREFLQQSTLAEMQP